MLLRLPNTKTNFLLNYFKDNYLCIMLAHKNNQQKKKKTQKNLDVRILKNSPEDTVTQLAAM